MAITAVKVTEHTRGGHPVREHTRSHPGSARQLTIFGIVAIVVWGLAQGQVTFSGDGVTAPPGTLPASVAPARPGSGR
ncbi:hypothetical protein J7I98_27085 [Streptomyces sp. ISL-98]|uniref:hypothetical protein n=1 Tax=Streptomyces sp. ISL-98 TaxID=2819192 RepID=UPI001BE51A4D|nr:hypothetical protein [Streptomyces sp. ISL-98]MBT2509473.1 hypothetical protein [Streptomyces sp. ISL-98]